KTLQFPSFERETEYVGLVSDDDEYPMLSGDLGSTDGLRMDKHDYRKITNEFVVPHSSAKHAKASRTSYMVGALARVNLNINKLHPKAKALAKALGLKTPCYNTFLNTACQLIECVHSLEDSIAILEYFKDKGVDLNEAIVVGLNENGAIPVKAGNGVGAVEVPRGILFHNYEVDDKGIIVNANCIIPTSQNVNNIEHDMKKLVPEILDKPDDQITLLMEMLVRAYDPCISCSAHFLDVKFIR
ncbi:MAG: nickel-dependent hydrogenase large subunit, partial [Candidatus Omnitrophota bacterium]